MSDPRTILIEVIQILSEDVEHIDPKDYLCLYHQDKDVRTCIHSMLRMYSCSVCPKGVLSPCFPSKNPKQCEHGSNCSYVLGHSIYLWASLKTQNLHLGEERGCGCNFYHSQQETQQIRDYAFRVMDELYDKEDLLSSPPIIAMRRIHIFYQTLLRRTFPKKDLPSKPIPVFNVSKGRASFEPIYSSNDGIFQRETEALQETVRGDFPSFSIYKEILADRFDDDLPPTAEGMDD
jgi:hypothetical protein